MTDRQITEQLERIPTTGVDFVFFSYALTDEWRSAGVGIESMEPILRFMEGHPGIDYGSPGPLVHFMEDFYGSEYEEMLLRSLGRRPTLITVWMLNRIINGAKTPEARDRFIEAMRLARSSPLADQSIQQSVDHFLEHQARQGKGKR